MNILHVLAALSLACGLFWAAEYTSTHVAARLQPAYERLLTQPN